MVLSRNCNFHVGHWKSGKRLPQITLTSRLPPATRSFLNEADLVPFIQAHWDVEVVSTGFTGSLYETMELMAHTDVFLGMHGEIDLAGISPCQCPEQCSDYDHIPAFRTLNLKFVSILHFKPLTSYMHSIPHGPGRTHIMPFLFLSCFDHSGLIVKQPTWYVEHTYMMRKGSRAPICV